MSKYGIGLCPICDVYVSLDPRKRTNVHFGCVGGHKPKKILEEKK